MLRLSTGDELNSLPMPAVDDNNHHHEITQPAKHQLQLTADYYQDDNKYIHYRISVIKGY